MIKAFHRPLFLNRLAEDLRNYDKNNDSERKVLEAHYLDKRRAPEDEVRHEYRWCGSRLSRKTPLGETDLW